MALGLEYAALLNLPQLADGAIRRSNQGVFPTVYGARSRSQVAGKKVVERGIIIDIARNGFGQINVVASNRFADQKILEASVLATGQFSQKPRQAVLGQHP